MNSFRPHLPGFMAVEREPEVSFETLEQLLAAPQPSRFAKAATFLRFSQSYSPAPFPDEVESETLLMAEQMDGSYWVVGYLKAPIDGLPAWKAPQKTQKP